MRRLMRRTVVRTSSTSANIEMRHTRLALTLVLLGASTAQAGLFDDEEARRAINEMRKAQNERIETLSRAQLELVGQLDVLRAELARLRGQVETLQFGQETTNKRQQDYYIDLDSRVRKIETRPEPVAAAPLPAAEAPAPKSDPLAETRDYEAALNLFKGSKFKEAGSAFETFVTLYPASELTPSAQFWLGNAHYAQRDCKKAIEAQTLLLSLWPEHARAPDALLAIATCRQELGDSKGARTALERIVASHAGTPAAKTASERLKKK